MSREGRICHLLGPRELVDMPTEVALRGVATQALVGGLSFVDAKLKVDWEPIRAMAAEAVKCKRADARAKAKAAQQGGPPPQPLGVTGDGVTPLTPVAGLYAPTRGGSAQPEDLEARRPCIPSLFNPVIMAFGSQLACEWTCVSRVNDLIVFSALTRANFIILLPCTGFGTRGLY